MTGEETGPEGELHSESRARGVALEFEPDLFREIVPLRDIAATVSLTRRMFRGQYDIVHLHSSKAGIVGRLAARLAEVPVVVHTVHGWGFNDEQHRLVSGTYQALERTCARWCDALVVVGSPYRDEGLALGIGEPSQYHLIRSGIKIGAYRTGADPIVDRAIALNPALEDFLGQDKDDATRLSDSFEQLILREGPDTVGAFIADGPQVSERHSHGNGFRFVEKRP